MTTAEIIDDGTNNLTRDAVTVARHKATEPEPVLSIRWCDYAGEIFTLGREYIGPGEEYAGRESWWTLHFNREKVGAQIKPEVLRAVAVAILEALPE